MKFFTDIFKFAFGEVKKNTTKIVFHNGSSIIFNGKKIDPKSPQGKKIIKEVEKDMLVLSKDMVKLGKELGSSMEDVAKAFKNFK